jgi:hypothetical protein
MPIKRPLNSSKNSAATRLSVKLENHLRSYATAAAAAGVGILALAQPANAEIIYTPANIRINHNTVLDLNNDGIADFTFTGYRNQHVEAGVVRNTYFDSSNGALSILGVGTANQVGGANLYAAALHAGEQIGSSAKFPGPNRIVKAHDINSSSFELYGRGPWAGSKFLGVRNRYLGLKFTIDGQTHFGWARLNVKIVVGAFIQATITGYAYEGAANTPIQAGKTMGTNNVGNLNSPGSKYHGADLGVLACGASGVELWRRKDNAACGEIWRRDQDAIR